LSSLWAETEDSAMMEVTPIWNELRTGGSEEGREGGRKGEKRREGGRQGKEGRTYLCCR